MEKAKFESEGLKFPNGLDSWQETHFEIVAHLIATEEDEGSMANTALQSQGHGGLYELAKDLVNRFETRFAGHSWDGDYFDAIETFLQEAENG